VLGSLRDSIAGERHAAPALFALPARGRLLVDSAEGPWIVRRDGSKRLLGDYDSASWSPHGLFVIAAKGNELAALTPGGEVRWTLARRTVEFPRWGGSRVDTRIAYLTAGRVHVVAGDGTGDAAACGERRPARAAPAWQPGAGHVLAYADVRGRVSVVDTGACSVLWRSPRLGRVRQLEWSGDGRRLLVLRAHDVLLFDERGRRVRRLPIDRVVAASFAPSRHRLVLIRSQDVLVLDPARPGGAQRVFAGIGGFTGGVWSPDGRWLLVEWASADQWIFVRTVGARRVLAVSNIGRQFGGAFPSVAGWCCG
jgi:hypothetical protein